MSKPSHGAHSRSASGTPTQLLAPAEVPRALPDIPGGEPGLLPIAALDAPLVVEIPKWPISAPTPDMPEKLQVFWNGEQVHEKEWTAPVPDADLILRLEDVHRVEGTHHLHYRVMASNGLWDEAEVTPVTVDRTRPELGGNGGRLVFDVSEVTVEYLEQHNDQLIGTVPDYTEVKAGDLLRWYWDTAYDDDYEVSTRTLTVDDVGKPVELIFPGTMIRAQGDGPRLARYQVRDRAGNLSAFASYVTLEAKANVPPRSFTRPNIRNSSPGDGKVTLDPLRANPGGAVVMLPEAADIRDDDTVWVQWGEKDAPGSYRTGTSVSPGVHEYIIPKEYVAFHITNALTVHYEVIDGQGREFVSQSREVEILAIPSGTFTTVQCEGVGGNNALSLDKVPPTGAKLTLEDWVMISADQVITIRVEGLNAAGAATSHTVIDKRRLTPTEVVEGIGMDGKDVIPKTFLSSLKLNNQFRVVVMVSFDQGQSWPPVPNFNRLDVKLEA